MLFRSLGKTNLNVSILGYGASPLGNVFDMCDEKDGIKSVHYAIDHGVNFFDVSPFYGKTLAETRLGKALDGKRNNIILASKAGRYDVNEFDFSYQKIIGSIDDSLRRLRTDYLDLYQLHDIEFGSKEQVLNEAIPAIQKIKESGKARFIGITGLPINYLAEIARNTEIDTVLSWAHYNLLADEINAELVPLSKKMGFGLMNAAPLIQRILSDAPLPVWLNASKELQNLQQPLLAICASFGVKLSDVAIRYALDHPDISTTIIGMCDLKTIVQNVSVMDFEIPEGLLAAIENIVKPYKNQLWYEGRPENNIARN